jgi:hypothetical protein
MALPASRCRLTQTVIADLTIVSFYCGRSKIVAHLNELRRFHAPFEPFLLEKAHETCVDRMLDQGGV